MFAVRRDYAFGVRSQNAPDARKLFCLIVRLTLARSAHRGSTPMPHLNDGHGAEGARGIFHITFR